MMRDIVHCLLSHHTLHHHHQYHHPRPFPIIPPFPHFWYPYPGPGYAGWRAYSRWGIVPTFKRFSQELEGGGVSENWIYEVWRGDWQQYSNGGRSEKYEVPLFDWLGPWLMDRKDSYESEFTWIRTHMNQNSHEPEFTWIRIHMNQTTSSNKIYSVTEARGLVNTCLH